MATSLSTTSLSGLGLSGLSSGLDTSGIITKLMAIEQAPQTQLKTQLSTATTYRTALQSLNTSVAAIATSATAAAKSGALASFTATSSTTAVTASATSGASAQTFAFSVDSVATAQLSYSSVITTSNAPTALTFHSTNGSAADVVVTPATASIDDLVTAVNSSAAGVTASKVLAGYDGTTPQYRLQLQAKQTGTASAFDVSSGSSFDASRSFATVATPSSNAKITMFGSPIEQATNTFALASGVSVTVAQTTSAATVTIAPDTTAATASATSLTASLTTLFSGIASATAVTTATSSTGSSASTTGSIFTGDALVRGLKDALLGAVTQPFADKNVSPSTVGITVTKDGTISFDSAAFQAAMQKDPVGSTATFQAIAANVAKVATSASASTTGTISLKITSQQASESSLTKQIGDWDTRLAAIQAQYTTQFNALETALNSLSSQASYLTSQISGLTTNYQK